MSRVARAVINLNALRHNLSIVRQQAPQSQVMAVIKANAYGHGMVKAAHTMANADAFGVASLNEAMQLRAAGIHTPITLLEGFTHPDDLEVIREHNLSCVIHHVSQLDMLERHPGKPVSVWLKVDTGMHRLGVSPVNTAHVYRRLLTSSAVVKPVRLMTHFARSDERNHEYTQQQIELFDKTTHGAETECSLANSGGILAWPGSHRQWVRPGIMLYGISPFVDTTGSEHQLQPVMTLHSALIAVNHFKVGDAVGYGGTWICPEDMPVGVVSIGYGDGYPRHAETGTPVLLNGRLVPLIGRVSMDMITVDLRSQPDAMIGDPIILWGDGLPAEQVAQHADTIAYELTCGVTQRVQFEYVG